MLSIIIPTCDRNDLLSKCLDCLDPEIQKCAVSYEVIVTDDGELGIAQSLIEDHYSWVKWIEGPKRGPASNRNNGAKYAMSEWIIFIDDDCLPKPDLIHNYYQEIVKGEYIALEGAVHAERLKERYDEEAPINLKGGCFWSCNIAITRALFFKLQGFDERFPFPAMEDIDFYDRVKAVAKVKFIENALVIHPWRRMVPFKSYKKHIASHRYFKNKNKHTRPAGFRISRVKIMFGHFFQDYKELASYSFKGTGFFLERVYLNFLMIFI